MARAVPDAVAAEIRTEILAGHKIAAIKLYRQASGEGLKEAKDFIESVEAELRRTEPNAFTAPPRGKGCRTTAAGLVLLFLTIIISGTLLW
jgi:hypothetical protein